MNEFNKDFIQYNDKKVKEEKHHLAFYLSTRIIFYIVLIFFAIFLIWYTAFVSTHSFYAVSGVSMMGTLNNQISDEKLHSFENLRQTSYDAVYVDKMTKPKLFDIVVIEMDETDKETGKKKSIIKRIMAQEGDYVTIAKATVAGHEHFYFHRIPAENVVDGKIVEGFNDESALLEENGKNSYRIYSYDDWDKEKAFIEAGEKPHFYETVFYDTYLFGYFEGQSENEFVVSDEGLVYVKVPEGKFFYMGDNRGHSDDARLNGFGDISKIVGRTEFIIHDFNFVNRLWEVVKFYFSEVENFFAR